MTTPLSTVVPMPRQLEIARITRLQLLRERKWLRPDYVPLLKRNWGGDALRAKLIRLKRARLLKDAATVEGFIRQADRIRQLPEPALDRKSPLHEYPKVSAALLVAEYLMQHWTIAAEPARWGTSRHSKNACAHLAIPHRIQPGIRPNRQRYPTSSEARRASDARRPRRHQRRPRCRRGHQSQSGWGQWRESWSWRSSAGMTPVYLRIAQCNHARYAFICVPHVWR